jgi:rare lipoprotein A
MRFDPRVVGVAVILAAAGFAVTPASEPAAAAPEIGVAAAAIPAGAEDVAARAATPSATAGSANATREEFEAAPELARLHPSGGSEVLDVLTGVASFYANSLAGRRTASGERYDPRALVAAHRQLPFGTRLRVTNPANDRSVEVRVIDRGPFTRGRVLDLSRRAAEDLGMIRRGHAPVRIEVLSYGN